MFLLIVLLNNFVSIDLYLLSVKKLFCGISVFHETRNYYGSILLQDILNCIQAALVICGLFICDFAYMRSWNDLFCGTYPLIISHPWSFYMRIHYMRVYFWSPYPSHITRSNCTCLQSSVKLFWLRSLHTVFPNKLYPKWRKHFKSLFSYVSILTLKS